MASLNSGEIDVHVGCMFSGKSNELVDVCRRTQDIASVPTQAFKLIIDNRGEGLEVLRGRGGAEFPATGVKNAEEILEHLSSTTRLVGIDEAQFFDSQIVEVIEELASRGLWIVSAGLQTDFLGKPFGPMPALMAIATRVTQHYALCDYKIAKDEICGRDATRTQRLVDGKPASRHTPLIIVGNEYAARCRRHHFIPD